MEPGDPEPFDGLNEPARKAERLRRLALRVDTQPALLTAAERFRQRLPGDERFGDPLSTAGPQPVEIVARGVSALQPQRRSFAQELGLAGPAAVGCASGNPCWRRLAEGTVSARC